MRRAVFLLFLALQIGCATVYTLSADRVESEMCDFPRAMPRWMPRVYSGARFDAFCLSELPELPVLLLCAVDIPFSLAFDTVVVPYTAYSQVAHGNYHQRFIAERHPELRGVFEQRRAAGDEPAERGVCASP
jgi:uncharacterized protein YceK